MRSQDASNFNAWFFAYLIGNQRGERVAEQRFRPQYDVAFRAVGASLLIFAGVEILHLPRRPL